jgi:hypothetical protein
MSILDPIAKDGVIYVQSTESSSTNTPSSGRLRLLESLLDSNKSTNGSSITQRNNTVLDRPMKNGRRLFKAEDFKATFDNPKSYTLRPLEIAKVIFDFSEVPELFLYNDHYSIIVLNEDNVQ